MVGSLTSTVKTEIATMTALKGHDLHKDLATRGTPHVNITTQGQLRSPTYYQTVDRTSQATWSAEMMAHSQSLAPKASKTRGRGKGPHREALKYE